MNLTHDSIDYVIFLNIIDASIPGHGQPSVHSPIKNVLDDLDDPLEDNIY